MNLQNKTILELKQILKEEFDLEMEGKDLHQFANSLVGYFDLLLKVDSRNKVRK